LDPDLKKIFQRSKSKKIKFSLMQQRLIQVGPLKAQSQAA